MSSQSYGYVRVAAAVPAIRVGDVKHNLEQHISLIKSAKKQHVQILVFPELSLTGYTCGDLFFSRKLLDETQAALYELEQYTEDMMVVVGASVEVGNRLMNTAAVYINGTLENFIPKTYLPNNGEFYEKRWFAGALELEDGTDEIRSEIFRDEKWGKYEIYARRDCIYDLSYARIGIEICEDLWSPLPPSTIHAMRGADIILNLSASNEVIGKDEYRRQLICQQSARTHTAYVYASAGVGESTQDTVYGGACYIAENGRLVAHNERFVRDNQLLVSDIDIEKLRTERMRNSNYDTAMQLLKDNRKEQYITHYNLLPRLDLQKHKLLATINPMPFVPHSNNRSDTCREVLSIQAHGLAKRWSHVGINTLVIGVSGGLDSTLALLVCVKTADLLGYDRKRIIGVTMPGFGTTGRTYNNALGLMKALGITLREISIVKSVTQHFEDIGHDINDHSVTYENSQARERTQILMDIANQTNGLVVGTGDLSELALGWATYNGDHMSMYGVNAGIPKTLVRYLVREIADEMANGKDSQAAAILRDVLDTPVSPELLPAAKDGKITQVTEDLVGPYELHDFFLYHFVRFGFTKDKIRFLAQQAFREKYDNATIDKWLTTFCRRFFNQQFKRSCMPDGPKVGSVNLSPRGDWRMPSDACCFLND